MAQFAFFYDQSRCNGCKTCQMACKDFHDMSPERTFVRVIEFETVDGEWKADDSGCYAAPALTSYFHQLSCNHCDDPACVKACPKGACTKDPDTGIVFIDPEICTGVKACAKACPYAQPTPAEDGNRCEKCDGCKDRLAEGLLPLCVEACPQRALTCGDAKDVPEGYERAKFAPLPDPEETHPNFYVKPCRNALPFDSDAGWIANKPEVNAPEEN